MANIPALKYTSFHAIVVTFEMWVLFGIIIIMNSKSNLDSAFKCFVFFLISQPLVYLLQVPFSWQGWGLFGYYKTWFIWTLLCFPMGFIGYFMDPFDDHVLELAIASQSQYIVTFNKKDFRDVERYGIEIVKPGEFFDIIEGRR